MRFIHIVNQSRLQKITLQASVCETFFSRFRGLMFRKSLQLSEAILLDEHKDSRVTTSIHMFFMRFDIAAVWINNEMTVVDCQIAKKWQPYYASQKPARFILEAHPDQLINFHIGDKIEFIQI